MTRMLMTSATLVATLTLCTASGLAAKTPGTAPTDGEVQIAAATATIVLPPYEPKIDPSRFSANITNRYFPLKPGTVFKFEGSKGGVPQETEMTVTSETRIIMGVPCIVVRDVVTSKTQLVEKTTDWYSQDSDGNVWYFGEETAEYKDGKVSSTSGTWMAGVNGALPGFIMKAAPELGEGYRQEFLPGVAEDYARVISNVATARPPIGDYENVLVTEDSDLLDRSKFEAKYFAKDVGFIGSQGMVNGHFYVTSLKSMLKAN